MKGFLALIVLVVAALAIAAGLEPPQPSVLIDAAAGVPIADDLILNGADWQRCAPVPMPPLTAPPPGKVSTDYRTRDGGIA